MKRHLVIGVAAIFLAGVASQAFAQVAASDSLEGLWVAKDRYGPDIRGPLMLRPAGSELIADVAGFSIPVKPQGEALSFELPDGKGNFRGIRRGATIEGQWIQAVTAGARYATPLIL